MDHHSDEGRQDAAATSVLSPVSSSTAVTKEALSSSKLAADASSSTPKPSPKKKRLQLSANRLLSLDLLRGLAILVMITCNAQMGDAVFYILAHPEWIGFTIADTVFPSFLFITGCTLPLSVRADPNPAPGSHYYRNHALRILKRSIIIWFLGVVLNLYGLVQLHVAADQFRWPGVLNRIGFCYLVVGWMHVLVLARGRTPEKPLSISYLYTPSGSSSLTTDRDLDAKSKEAQEDQRDDTGPWPWFVRVTLPYYLPVSCLVVWLICTYSVQVKGCPRRGMVEVPECSAQAYFDLIIFGTAHTYRHLAFDPEGALSTLTSILNVWLGWFIGCTVRSLNAQVKQLTNDFKARKETRNDDDEALAVADQVLEQEMLVRLYASHLSYWFWLGILWTFTGWVFSLGLPLSKPSWTATFAVMSSGISQTVLSILFYKFDAQPKFQRLEQLHLEHQAYRSNNQLSRHHHEKTSLPGHNADDLEQPVTTTTTSRRSNYSGVLHLYFKVDHFLRHWFRKAVVVVLGSMGRNAILMYMCSELVQGTCSLIPGGPADPVTGDTTDLCGAAFKHTWGALDIGGWASLFYSLGFAALHVLLAIFLDHKKWYFKV
ncbi:hypothetical protein KVV02_005908 [Mortierella alpina]|uniref:Heparan-alpha-glucosaminide N-acetyltransferase catalytic domain-containing protein n=1 Tax=Mortierella alpina TaxID=64518 RepID=A0A9P8CZJ6_MORAP|nr:hypothetical protein KVV02_005908 [Mortierella alpina]